MTPPSHPREEPGRAPRARRGSWPATDSERADRSTVVDLVRRVGRERLRFGVADLQRLQREEPRFRLAHPGALARHLRALVPSTVTPIAQPLADFAVLGGVGGDAADDRAGEARPTRHLYALTDRLIEHDEAPMDWPEPARVYVALWVASAAAGGVPVETNAVTRVCGTIEELAVDKGVQMSTRLAALESRALPLVRRADADGTRAGWLRRRWLPAGARPDDPRLDDWVTIMRALEEGVAAPRRVGHVTLHDLMAELLDITIARSRSPTFWPEGRSVTVEDVAAACAADPRARELDTLLRMRGTSRGRVLGDASKARIAGRDRVHRQIVKVGQVPGSHTYYDLPGRRGYEARQLIVPYETLRHALRAETFDALAAEYKAASRLLAGSTDPVVAAIAAVRTALAHRTVGELERHAQALSASRHLLSDAAWKAVERDVRRIAETRSYLGIDEAEALELAGARVAAVGGNLAPILDAQRPLLTGEEFVEWIPRAQRNGRTGPELLADATVLTRFANPAHTRRSDADGRRAAVTAVDRVDALLHLAEKLAARTLTFLQGGADLLGTGLRDACLPTMLLVSSDDRLWARGLAALALLGDPAAERGAIEALSARNASSSRIVRALYALCVVRRVEPERWPDHVRASRDAQVVAALRDVLAAPRSARWLL